MTVESLSTITTQAGAGAVLNVGIPCEFYQDSDVKVYVSSPPVDSDHGPTETLLVKDVDYTITKALVSRAEPPVFTGSIDTLAAVAAGDTLVVHVSPDNEQKENFTSKPYDPAAIERTADVSCLRSAALSEREKRFVRLPLSYTGNVLTLQQPEPGKAMIGSADGKALIPGPDAADIAGAQDAAAVASAAALAAAASAGDAAAVLASSLLKANNLSDLADAATARTNIGLGEVDNTSDANKPVSTATAAAIAAAIAAITLSTVLYFDTVADAVAAEIPPEITTVATVGCYDVEDGAGWMWTNRSAVPAGHSGKFQSLDGDWWEVADRGPVPLPCWGCPTDGATNCQGAIESAFGTGYKLSGVGYTYAIDFAVDGRLDLVANLHLENCGFIQLSADELGHRYDLYGTSCHNLTLKDVWVNKNGNGFNDGSISATMEIGHLNDNAGIWLVNSNNVLFERVEVYGDDSGNGIRWENVNFSKMIDPYVHDMGCTRQNMDVAIDDQMCGIALSACTTVEIHNPRVARLYVTLVNPRISSMAGSSTTLYVPEAMAEIGRTGAITVNGAGPGGVPLVTSIVTRQDSGTFILADAASTPISNERVFITTSGPRHNRGMSFGGCTGVLIFNPQLEECGQAMDFTGSVINSSCAVYGGYIRHCWDHAIKMSNAAHLVTAHGVKAEWIGLKAFVIIGTSDPGVATPTLGSSMHGCTSHYQGALLPSTYGNVFFYSRTDITCFRIEHGDLFTTTYPQQCGFFDCMAYGTGAADFGFFNNVAGAGNLNSNNRTIGTWKNAAVSWA